MSETEVRSGKLVPTGKTEEQFLDDYDYTDGIYELSEEFNIDLAIIDNMVWLIEDGTDHDPNDFAVMNKNEDGSIDFVVGWYNGAGGLSEVLESHLKELDGEVQ